MISKILDLAM